jgi:putative acetyltransferase
MGSPKSRPTNNSLAPNLRCYLNAMTQTHHFAAAILAAAIFVAGCSRQVPAFSPAQVDRTISGQSRYPVAADIALVGTYPGRSHSGAGYFYDQVLEYRVWLHPENGAEPRAGDKDYFAAFAQYEPALAFSQSH